VKPHHVIAVTHEDENWAICRTCLWYASGISLGLLVRAMNAHVAQRLGPVREGVKRQGTTTVLYEFGYRKDPW